jgi:GMP synthase-like glutamine amidotransferase
MKEKVLAIIDPYIISPSLKSYTRIKDLSPYKCRYYQPSNLGFERLIHDENIAYIILGSASHLYQKLPWHQTLSDFVLEKLKMCYPTLGICFGHQLVCSAFGAQVEYVDAKKSKLTGTRIISIEKPFFNFNTSDQLELAISHQQVVKSLPLELESLACAVNGELFNEIVRHKKYPFFGTQAHIESQPQGLTTESQSTNLDFSKNKKASEDGGKIIKGFFQYYF